MMPVCGGGEVLLLSQAPSQASSTPQAYSSSGLDCFLLLMPCLFPWILGVFPDVTHTRPGWAALLTGMLLQETSGGQTAWE